MKDVINKIIIWIGTTESLLFHTVMFTVCFSLMLFDWSFAEVLLLLTTIVSIEAIYLAIFLQIAVNQNTEDLKEVQEEIHEDDTNKPT